MFFKSLYSVKETAELLNDYFSVKTFSQKDIVNMFFNGEIDFSVRFTFTSLMGVNIDDDLLHCDISLNGVDLDDIEHSIRFTDGYAEINSLHINGRKELFGGGLFNVNRELSNTKKELVTDYLLIEQVNFIEYANVEICPEIIEDDILSLSFTNEYSDQIPIKLSSILITQKSVLDCILIIEKRAENAKFALQANSQKYNIDQPLSKTNTKTSIESENNLENYKPENLREFIELIIDPALLDENSKLPTYSRLYTKLENRHKGKRHITSKNTIRKYLNDL